MMTAADREKLKLITSAIASWDFLIKHQRADRVDADVLRAAIDNWLEATEALTLATIAADPTHVVTPEVEQEVYRRRTFRRAMRALKKNPRSSA